MSRPYEFIVASCEGKDRLTHERAHSIARRQRRKGHRVQAYKCPVCGSWHIGRPKS